MMIGNNKRKERIFQIDYRAVIGKKRPFATAEAYKRLRANVMFSFAGDADCRVIGITSAMAHEGKTTTSINLAYDLIQAGMRVLLIDGDMRMSHIAKILNIQQVPGLSDLLVGVKDQVRYVQVSAELGGLQIIPCGNLPPNPSELLASKRMGVLLNTLKQKYDYIIIDLPPLTAVSDALIVSKLIDGMVLVVRQDYADKHLVNDAVRQLQFHEANIIGYVMNCTHIVNKYYGKYGRYGKYSRYSKYGDDSDASAEQEE